VIGAVAVGIWFVVANMSGQLDQPSEPWRDCEECPWIISLPGGTFMMGAPDAEEGRDDSEGPQHEVAVQTFAIGQHEVTFDEWDVCVTDGGCSYNPKDRGWDRSSRPVIDVSWQDAQQYVDWLKDRTGEHYRLPTEAEWEYAARAGTRTPFSTGATISTDQANYDGDHTYGSGSKGEFRGQTTPVGTFDANPWGLYDMHGNVWEWVEDCWSDSYEAAPKDGSAWTRGDCRLRVLRGGSWGIDPQDLRSAGRSRLIASSRNDFSGFRVARMLGP